MTPTKFARLSTFSRLKGLGDDMYECKKEWPTDCFCQAGQEGYVATRKGGYKTAFFEAFIKVPDTFIRGEGKTVEDAESNAWEQYTKIIECKGHEFERRGYENGAGFCKHCNLFSPKQFEPTTTCVMCGKPTYHSSDKKNNFWCEDHYKQIPEEDMFDFQKGRDDIGKNLSAMTDESFGAAMEIILEVLREEKEEGDTK